MQTNQDALPHYLTNKELLTELRKSKAQNELTEDCKNMFRLMAVNVSRKFSYQNPMDRDDCIQEGVFDCLKYWRGFDEAKCNPAKAPNPFSYFTSVLRNGMAKGFNALHPKDMKTVPISLLYSLTGENEE